MLNTKTHGSPGQKWHQMFTPAHRKEAASHWEVHHRDELHEEVKNETLVEK